MKSMRLIALGALLLASFGLSSSGADTAPQVTFNKDVAPIFFKNCVACYRARDCLFHRTAQAGAFLSLRAIRRASPAVAGNTEIHRPICAHQRQASSGLCRDHPVIVEQLKKELAKWEAQLK
jgi:hypothetical protein